MDSDDDSVSSNSISTGSFLSYLADLKSSTSCCRSASLLVPTIASLPANEVLAKHDETYMPKEIADSLKDKGLWKDEGQ